MTSSDHSVSMKRSYSEKRNFIRMKVNTPVSVHYAGRDYHGVCKDLSGAGMQIEINEAFTIGDVLTVSIQPRGETHLPFNARVEITRIEGGGANAQSVGLAIREILD